MNNNYDSKKKFRFLTSNSFYLRVDETHNLELLIGLNDNGQKTIRFVGDFTKVKVKGTKAIDINHYTYFEKYIISFSLVDSEYNDLFYLFCNDLIDSSRNIDQKDGYIFLVNRFEKWRGFGLSVKKYLSENQIKGLIGELLLIKEFLISIYGISRSINGWSGPVNTHKDFSFDDIWYEVKTVTKNYISISSIEQLDSQIIGYLIVYNLEKMSPESNGITLNKLVDSILELIIAHDDKAIFLSKLMSIGYFKEEIYDTFVFQKRQIDFFEVTENFPRIRKNQIPSAVTNVKYDIIVNMLNDFRRDSI